MKVLICMLIIGLMVSTVAYADLADGLVAYWSFDVGTAKDDSGNGNKGVIKGSPRSVPGKAGLAFDFDGVDDGIDVASNPSLELPNELTCAAWIYPRATQNAAGLDHAGICWKGNKIGWGADAYNWRIATAGDAGLTWGSCGGGTEGYFATANCFTNGLNTWYHVALVEDGTVGTAYVNGVAMTAADVTGGNMDPPRPPAPFDTWPDEPVRIGWSQGRGGDIGPDTDVYFDGIIDEVVLYNRVLSAAEIIALMGEGLPATAVEPGDKLTTTWSQIKAY
jgi:hypothetical protein